jgi:hypothetical protein
MTVLLRDWRFAGYGVRVLFGGEYRMHGMSGT